MRGLALALLTYRLQLISPHLKLRSVFPRRVQLNRKLPEQLVTESHLSIGRRKRAGTRSLDHSGRGSQEVRVENKIGYWFGCWKVVHKRQERVPFYAKREAALIDGWAHIGCQGRKMSEKSNSAFELEDKPIPARESFVAFRWMSFILPLAALSISKLFLHWLLDQSHTLTTQNCKHIYI